MIYLSCAEYHKDLKLTYAMCLISAQFLIYADETSVFINDKNLGKLLEILNDE